MTCNVTGTAISPNGQIKPGAKITFRRAQLDVVSQEGFFVIPDDYIIQTALDGTVDFDILPGVYDATTVAVGGRDVAFRVSVPDEPAADFADLLNASYVEIPPASVTQAQQARDAAIAARDVAVAARDDAVLYDGPKVDTFAELASVTPTQLAVGEYIRVIATGAVYQRVSTGGDLDYSGTGGVRLNVVPNSAGEINALAVAALSDGGDISLAISRAINRASALGGARVVLPPGDYTAATTIQIGGFSAVDVVAHGANITITQPVAFFRAAAPIWEAVQSISPVDGDDFWGARYTVTVSDGSAYAVGDLVKIVSDDKQRCTRAAPGDGTDYRSGWMGFVMSVAGNVLTLDNPCPFDLVTNPRIGRMPRRFYSWTGGRVGYAVGVSDVIQPNPFIMYGVSDLKIDVDIARTPATAISVVGCFRATVNARGDYHENNTSVGSFGYLVNDAGSYFTRADVNACRSRHGYTTNQPLVSANSSALENYGGTYGALVTGQSHGQSQAGFDTHHGSENVTFSNVVVSGGSEGGGQIVLRGVGHRVISPQCFNGKYGVLCYNEDGVTNGNSSATVISGQVDVDQEPLRVLNGGEITLDGGSYRSRKYGEIAPVQGKLSLRGAVTFRPGGSASVDNSRAIRLNNASVDARGSNVIFDLQDIPSGASEYGLVTGAGSTFDTWAGGTIRTVNDAGLNAVFYKQVGATSVCQFSPELIVTQKLGTNPATTCAITGAPGVGFTGPWAWRTESGAGRSGYVAFTLTDGYVIPLLGRSDPVVTCRFFASTNRTLGAIPNGAMIGQMLALSFVTSGGATITVLHGASGNTSLPGGANFTVSGEGGLLLIWNGTRWSVAA